MSTRQGDTTPTVSNADNDKQQIDIHTTTSVHSLKSVSNAIVNAGQLNTIVPTDKFNELMKSIGNLNLNNGSSSRKRHRDPQECHVIHLLPGTPIRKDEKRTEKEEAFMDQLKTREPLGLNVDRETSITSLLLMLLHPSRLLMYILSKEPEILTIYSKQASIS